MKLRWWAAHALAVRAPAATATPPQCRPCCAYDTLHCALPDAPHTRTPLSAPPGSPPPPAQDGNYVPAKDIASLENLPTKTQLIGKIAGSIKQVTTKLAVGTRAITAKVAYGVKEIADGKSELIKA